MAAIKQNVVDISNSGQHLPEIKFPAKCHDTYRCKTGKTLTNASRASGEG